MSGASERSPAARALTKTAHDSIKAELARFIPSFEKILPKGYAAERLVTNALVAVSGSPDLLKCTPGSIVLALARIAQWNLDVGTTAHLIAYGTTCTAVADYKGLIRVMCDAGARKVEPGVVRRGDHFDFAKGTEPYLRHRPVTSTGEILGAYAIVWLRGGITQFEYLTVEEIEAIRKRYSNKWKQGELPSWYAKKTAIRQLAKYVNQTPRLQAVLKHDEALDLETGEVTPELLARLEQPAPEPSTFSFRPVRHGAYEAPEVGTLAPEAKPRPAAAPTEPGDAAEEDLKLDQAIDSGEIH